MAAPIKYEGGEEQSRKALYATMRFDVAKVVYGHAIAAFGRNAILNDEHAHKAAKLAVTYAEALLEALGIEKIV